MQSQFDLRDSVASFGGSSLALGSDSFDRGRTLGFGQRGVA